MPSFIFLLVAIIAFARFAAAAEELWEASPRSFTLTKGKAAAANSGVSSSLTSSSLVSVGQYNVASTPDGTIFLSDGGGASGLIYSYAAPYTTAPAQCGGTFAIGVAPDLATGSSITNNGNTLYFLNDNWTAIKSSAVTSSGAKGAPKTYNCATAGTATTFAAGTTSTLSGAIGVAIFYAPGLLSAAKAPKATKGSTTDAFVLVGGSSATQMGISIVSTVTSSSATAVDTVGYNAATYAALTSTPCDDVQLNYIGGVAISGKDIYVSSYVYLSPTYAIIYKITTALGSCTTVTEFAGTDTGTAPTTLVVGVKGTGTFVTAVNTQSLSLVFSGSTLYVSEVGGIAAVNADTGSIIGYVVGQDASAATSEGVGSYSNWKHPGALVIPAGKEGGNLIATDLTTTTNAFRKVTWAGAAKVKVGAPKAPKP